MEKSKYRRDQLKLSQYEISKEEMDRICNVGCKSLKQRYTYITLQDTLLRREEFAKLRIENVDFSKRRITIIGKGNKRRVVPITLRALNLIKDIIGERKQGFILRKLARDNSKKYSDGHISIWAVDKIIRKIGQNAEFICPVPGRKFLFPHLLRHSMSRYFRKNGMRVEELQNILGHQSAKTTQDTYAVPSIDTTQDTYDRIIGESKQDTKALIEEITKEILNKIKKDNIVN